MPNRTKSALVKTALDATNCHGHQKAATFPIHPKELNIPKFCKFAEAQNSPDGIKKAEECLPQTHPKTYSRAPKCHAETRNSATSRDSATRKA